MTTLSRPDMEHIGEDVGPQPTPFPKKSKSRLRPPPANKTTEKGGGGPDPTPPDLTQLPVTNPIPNTFGMKTPEGVALAPAGAPAQEIDATVAPVVVRFRRGRVIFHDPIDTLVALEDAPIKLTNGTASELAGLLREAIASTATIEFDQTETEKQEDKQLTFTETRAISDALVKWSESLGKS